MKKNLSRVLLALVALSLSLNVAMPRKANAGLISDAVFGTYYTNVHQTDVIGAMVCLIFLPICILDQKTDGQAGAVSKADLVANGYSDAEIGQIMQDQAIVQAQLQNNHLALQITSVDTKANVAAEIRSVAPSVSDMYIDFVTSSAALK